MHKIGANLIFTMTGKPLKQGYLMLDNNNVIVDIIDTEGKLKETHGLAFYSGILIPGLIVGKNPTPLFPLDFSTNKNARILYQKGLQASDLSMEVPLSINDIFNYPNKRFDQALSECTIQAAKKFNLSSQLGSFEIGKSPGILHIHGFDFKNQTIFENALITRLV